MHIRKRFTRLMAILFVLALLLPSTGIAQAGKPGGGLKDHYIVVFKEGVNINASAPDMEANYGLTVSHVYRHALKGMAAYIPEGRLTAFEHDPRVAYVVEDMLRTVGAQTVPTGVQRIFADENGNIDIDGTDDYRLDVDVAIIDTGIDLEHTDLNVVSSTSCMNTSGGGPPWSREYYCGEGGDDDHYHGTHVAGSVAALDNGFGVVGVAPGARLWAVKVCDGQGSCPSSAIIAGIDYVAANAADIEVANMSLGGSGFSQAEYDAIQGAVDAGVAFAVAAGNDNDDASNYSPAAFDNALTVSALADFDGEPGGLGSPTCYDDQDDTLADFSNWGSAVDIAAPGACIYSTFPIEEGEYGTISGTSMASPHAAGALALLASANNPANATDVYNLYDQVINAGNFDWTDDSGDGIQEPLLDVSDTSLFAPVLIETGGTTDSPPSVSITSPADGASFDSGASIDFAGSATDNEDGDLTSELVWTSDLDGQIGTGGSFTAVLSDGTHTITAEVTDSGDNTGSDSITITVGGGSGGDFTLSVSAYKVRGTQYADLTWSGATSTNVDIYRDGSVVATTENDGAHTDTTGQKGGGSAIYQVCEAGTSTCSNEVTATW
ncbi:MAG: S8 family serine peptidase [Anaerolineales bacterium]|nr:S8 family serine peptidase [Anaerolineales bacterium]MBS3752354.1 S8 family serine peptidase [Anaerolineales bacterium]